MYYFYILGTAIVLILPRCTCYWLAKAIALGHYYFVKKDRDAVIYNLRPIIKDKTKIKSCAKEVFINFAYYLVDFFRYFKLDKKFIDKYVRFQGLENLDKAYSNNKGVIVIGAHLGNYELAGAIAALLGYPLSAVVLPHKDERTNRFFDNNRMRTGMKVITLGSAAKGCLKTLRRGELIALLADRDFSGSKLKVKIFSKHAYLPRGIAFFAAKTDAAVVPGFLVRENKYFYKLVFEEAISFDNIDKKDEMAIINKYKPILEKYIEMYPNQWYLFEKYWLPE